MNLETVQPHAVGVRDQYSICPVLMSTKKTMQLKAERPLLDETSLQSGPGADSLSLELQPLLYEWPENAIFRGHFCSNLPYLQ